MRREAVKSQSTPTQKRGLGQPNHMKGFWECGLPMAIFLFLSLVILPISSGAQKNQTPGHLSKTLELPLEGETIPKTLKFPVYEQNSVHYFSAGLGKEERSLAYPSYPLKLIFVQGERAYLAGITVHISQADGKPLLTIPGEEVQGPWLFIDVPTGKYVITGTNNSGINIEKTLLISQEKTTVVHFRWP